VLFFLTRGWVSLAGLIVGHLCLIRQCRYSARLAPAQARFRAYDGLCLGHGRNGYPIIGSAGTFSLDRVLASLTVFRMVLLAWKLPR
jgi:hypothetical protein